MLPPQIIASNKKMATQISIGKFDYSPFRGVTFKCNPFFKKLLNIMVFERRGKMTFLLRINDIYLKFSGNIA